MANPTLTEEATHALESDEAAWRREFAAIPQAELESSLLTEALIDRATRAEPGDMPRRTHRSATFFLRRRRSG